MLEVISNLGRIMQTRGDRGGGLRVIEHNHSRAHDGMMWTHAYEFSGLSAGQSVAIGVSARPNKKIHIEALRSADSSGFIRLFRNPTYTGGTTVAGGNANFDSDAESPALVVSDPVVTNDGSLFSGVAFASGSGHAGGGQSNTTYELQLGAASRALIRFTAKTNDTAGFIVVVVFEEVLD